MNVDLKLPEGAYVVDEANERHSLHSMVCQTKYIHFLTESDVDRRRFNTALVDVGRMQHDYGKILATVIVGNEEHVSAGARYELTHLPPAPTWDMAFLPKFEDQLPDTIQRLNHSDPSQYKSKPSPEPPKFTVSFKLGSESSGEQS